LPSVFFGILGIIGVYFLATILISGKSAFFSALTLSTSVIYIALARACVTDMVLTVSIIYTFLFFFYGFYANTEKRKWYLLSACCVGIAVLTKGPIGLFFPVIIIGIFLAVTGKIGKIKEMPLFPAGLLFLAISAPWYFIMFKVHGNKFIDVFFGFHNIVRFLEPEHKIGDVFYYYIPIVLGGFAPWVAFLPGAIWQALRENEKKIKDANIFLGIWFIVMFTFFSFSRTKLPTYIFPLFPSIALIVGRFWDIILSNEAIPKIRKWNSLFIHIFLIMIAGSMVALYFVAKKRYPDISGVILIMGAAFTIFMAMFTFALLRKKYIAGFYIFITSFVISIFPITYVILPGIGKYESSKTVSLRLLEYAEPHEEIGAETQYRRGVAFYTGRENVPDIHKHDAMTKFLSQEERVWCVIKEKNHIQLYTDEKAPYDKPTYVVYKLGKKVIVTNQIPEDETFIKMRTANEPY